MDNPLAVCSVFHGGTTAITCPVRFREEWLIVDDAAGFFFAPDTRWTLLPEVRLYDKYGKSAGNIDVVLVAYDNAGKVVDFGSLEIQAVYVSGNIRTVFEAYMHDPRTRFDMDWTRERNYPRPDFLSSSRKRLAPQLMYKGGILSGWGKKQVVAVDRAFFATLPNLPEVPVNEAAVAWFVYDLRHDDKTHRYHLERVQTAYTSFEAALTKISVAEAPPLTTFLNQLQARLDIYRAGAPQPESLSLIDVLDPAEPDTDPGVV